VTAEEARDTARYYKGMADHMRDLGASAEANRLERQSNWWLAYSVSLASDAPKP